VGRNKNVWQREGARVERAAFAGSAGFDPFFDPLRSATASFRVRAVHEPAMLFRPESLY